MPTSPVLLRPDRGIAPWLLRGWELLAPRLPPSALRLIGRALRSLPHGSRHRRWFLLQFLAVGWEVTARTRYDLALPMWDPGCEWHWDPTFKTLGFDGIYRGHEGVKRSLATWNELWTGRSFRVREVLDGGDTVVARMTAFGRGVASGAPVQMDFTSVIRLDPLIVDFRNYAEDGAALREAGFSAAAQQPAASSRS